jgi:hypothetical protein
VLSGLTVKLRAERCGTGNGRVHTITVQYKDASGNASTKTTTVLVKKNSRGQYLVLGEKARM